ncbi:MAG: polysaccharide biosynthesis/export family protein [Pseudomonadota bacterium]
MIARFIALFMACALASCTTLSNDIAIEASEEVLVSDQRYRIAYIINPGDVIEVIVDRLPDLSRTVTVRSDGFVTLPKLGDIAVAGKTVTDASDTIEEAYSTRLINPSIDLIITNPPVPNIYVTGEVGRPSAIPLRQVPTAAEALVVAGGTTRGAKLNSVALIRLEEDGYLRARLIESAGGGRAGMLLALRGVPLRAGDIIVVQESGRSQFARALQDFVTTPLSAVNALISPYVQLELLRELNEE